MTYARTILVFAAVILLATRGIAETPKEIFERRIVPIFQSPNPSSCTECHLSGVDLKQYILPSHEQTFLSLRDQGLIDLRSPEKSKILRFIGMKPETNSGAALIPESVRSAELDAFRKWIIESCKDDKLTSAAPLNAASLAKPGVPVEVIRHARADNLLASFVDNVWAQRFRCVGCHLPGSSENAKLVEKHGEEVNWIQPQGAEATMRYLISNELINVTAPEKSKLLLKPLNEIKHGGGQKMLVGDLGYKAFRSWIEDYANVVKGGYASISVLPNLRSEFDAFPSEIWLKLKDTPADWGDKLLQVTMYAWDNSKWESDPIAQSDRLTWGKGKLWQHNLLLLARKNSERAREWRQGKPALPKGRYLIRVHVDAEAVAAREWRRQLGVSEFVGEVAIESNWPKGYGRMTVVEADQVRR